MAATAPSFVPNGTRKFRANGEKSSGGFRRGNSRSLTAYDDRLVSNDDLAGPDDRFTTGEVYVASRSLGLGDSVPIVFARKPFADTPFEPRIRPARKAVVCPGCGIVPPIRRKCDNCWD